MMPKPDLIRTLSLSCLAALLLAVLSLPALARDLDAASDGEHLWLVVEDPQPKDKDKPQLLIYHLAADGPLDQMVKLDPMAGELMPRGLAAGDGQLLMVLTDRQLQVVGPAWSKLQQGWVYETRALPALPKGCALVSVALGRRGPWALVRVESNKALQRLDREHASAGQTVDQRALVNRALGLPESFELAPTLEGTEPDEAPDASPDEDETNNDESADGELPPEAEDIDPSDASQEPAAQVPAYRLIHLHGSRWITSPLPDDFIVPRHAQLVMRDSDVRPTLILDTQSSDASIGELIRYIPIEPVDSSEEDVSPGDEAAEGPVWATSRATPLPRIRGNWSVTRVSGQLVIAVERIRSDHAVTIELLLLRGAKVSEIQTVQLPTNGSANWSVMPWHGGVAVVARPGPKAKDAAQGEDTTEPIAGLIALTLQGETIRENEEESGVVPLYESVPTPLEASADRIIQIGSFVVAMVMIMLFYRRATRADQLDLPERVELAPFSRRMFAGVIDLMPGFWLAGMMYGVGIGETLQLWPGNGLDKVLPAMRPGFVVIAVTVLHTAVFEFITARSIGKWATGLYVADLKGKPAPPGPSLLRAVTRVFDLFAPLLLILAVISPGRQRLGDIMAKTIVAVRLPEEIEEEQQPPDDDGF